MKLTKTRLKQIIKEELQHVMLEEGAMDKLRKTGKWLSREFAGETKKIVGAVNDSLKELFTDEELASLRQAWENPQEPKECPPGHSCPDQIRDYGGGKPLDDIIKEWIPKKIKIDMMGEARNIADTVRSILNNLVAYIVNEDVKKPLRAKVKKYGDYMENYTNAAIKHVGRQDMKAGTYRERKPRK